MDNNDRNKDRLSHQYDMFASKFNEIYLAGKERSREAMNVALEKAREQLTAVGEFSAEQGEELKKFLSRDLDQTIANAQQLGDEAKEKLHPARLTAGALSSLVTVLDMTGNALRSLRDKAMDTLTYKTGEITSAGTLTCKSCGQKVHITHSGHVPPCPKCSGVLFTKGY